LAPNYKSGHFKIAASLENSTSLSFWYSCLWNYHIYPHTRWPCIQYDPTAQFAGK